MRQQQLISEVKREQQEREFDLQQILQLEQQKVERQYQERLQIEKLKRETRLNSFEQQFLQTSDAHDENALDLIANKLDALHQEMLHEKQQVEGRELKQLKSEAELRYQERLHRERLETDRRLHLLQKSFREAKSHGMCLRSHIQKGLCPAPKQKLSY